MFTTIASAIYKTSSNLNRFQLSVIEQDIRFIKFGIYFKIKSGVISSKVNIEGVPTVQGRKITPLFVKI